MEKYELQKLRDLPIEGVAERLGLQVSRHKCLCPFHDDHHASLSFRVSKNTFRCFVCGASGGTIDLVMKYLNKDFPRPCRWLADDHNVIPWEEWKLLQWYYSSPQGGSGSFDASRYERFFERPWLNDEARRFLFEERRIDPRVVRWCRLTSWKDKQGVPWLQIPYYNREGKLVGIQNRNLMKGRLAPFPIPAGLQVWHLQPARAEPAATGRRPLHHRGLLRLLGHALSRSQGHRHPVGHAADARTQSNCYR